MDPDVYVVLDEKLFLFSNADARTAFENEEPGIVQVAEGKWAEIESELAQKKGDVWGCENLMEEALRMIRKDGSGNYATE